MTDSDFDKVIDKAQQDAQQNTSEGVGIDRKASEQKQKTPGDLDNHRELVGTGVPPRGFEPLSPP